MLHIVSWNLKYLRNAREIYRNSQYKEVRQWQHLYRDGYNDIHIACFQEVMRGSRVFSTGRTFEMFDSCDMASNFKNVTLLRRSMFRDCRNIGVDDGLVYNTVVTMATHIPTNWRIIVYNVHFRGSMGERLRTLADLHTSITSLSDIEVVVLAGDFNLTTPVVRRTLERLAFEEMSDDEHIPLTVSVPDESTVDGRYIHGPSPDRIDHILVYSTVLGSDIRMYLNRFDIPRMSDHPLTHLYLRLYERYRTSHTEYTPRDHPGTREVSLSVVKWIFQNELVVIDQFLEYNPASRGVDIVHLANVPTHCVELIQRWCDIFDFALFDHRRDSALDMSLWLVAHMYQPTETKDMVQCRLSNGILVTLLKRYTRRTHVIVDQSDQVVITVRHGKMFITGDPRPILVSKSDTLALALDKSTLGYPRSQYLFHVVTGD